MKKKFCPYCGAKFDDGARFCKYCGEAIYDDDQKTQNSSDERSYTENPAERKTVYDGYIHKCPNCGEVLKAFTAICPSCGYEIREASNSSAIQKFAMQLASIKSCQEKVAIIRNFPIPNTKEDIWEFMILASSNVDENIDGEISSAWQAKLEQVVQKARLVLTNESDLASIEKQYQSILKRLGKKRKEKAAKKMGKAASELIPILPRLIIIYAWLVSIFVLIPQCRVNLDGVGTNGFQLLLMIDFIAGAILIPVVLRCSEALPKVLTSAGIALSIIVIVPLCRENLDVAGTNAFHLILIVEIICVIVIIIRAVKYAKKSTVQNDAANGMTFVVTIVCMAVLFGIYGIESLTLPKNITSYSKESPSITEKTSTNDAEGIYTYEIRNYIGKNVASIGEMQGAQLVDEYGSGDVRIVFITEDGMIIASDDDEEKKQYVVVGQNLQPGTNITVVHLRDSEGEPYSNLVDYQSYEEILLYVAPIGDSSYDPDYTDLQPTLDRHSFWIRDYVGRNAASFGSYFNEGRIDEYGAAELKLSFSSENGEYIDTADINTLKKYIIISQDIAPNTELKLEYETDSRGNEYDNLIRSQNYEEINLVVKSIDKSIVEKMPELSEASVSSKKSEYVELTINYRVLSNGKAEITGFSGNGNHATIDRKIDGHGVISIGDSAFKDCTTLESVLFWADIESIGDYAFAGCTALKEISIPNETKSIGEHAFEGCTNLASLIIWGNASIGDYAFAACESIDSVSISMDTERIGSHAFDGCLNLKSALVWDDDTIVEKDAFANCPMLADRPIQD